MQDIIVSDHVIAPTTPASRTSPSSPFQRFTNSIRKSFNRIRTSQRRKPVKTRRNLAEKDGAISDDYDEISGRKSVDLDCESVDSGLETDQSSDLTPSSKTTEYNTKSCLRKDTSSSCNSNNAFTSSNRSSSYYQDSLLSTTSSNIDRKSSARSNHTIDSGILVNSQKRQDPHPPVTSDVKKSCQKSVYPSFSQRDLKSSMLNLSDPPVRIILVLQDYVRHHTVRH